MITAEKKKKKLVGGGVNYHTYYHCTRKRPCSQKGAVTEQDLNDQLYELLDIYELTPKLYEWGVAALNELAKEEIKQRDDVQAMQFDSIATVQKKLDNLLDLAEFGSITPEVYKQRSEKFTKELKKAQEQQAKTAENVQNWYEIVGKTLETLTNANEKFAKGEISEKQQVLMAIGQNHVLYNGKLLITPNKWLIPVQTHAKTMREHLNLVRTMPDKIRDEYENALLKTWYTVVKEVRTAISSLAYAS
ncbi:MAG TPA: hypothetical protein VF733_04320 [Candidatus Saccharimonadales bacterium]